MAEPQAGLRADAVGHLINAYSRAEGQAKGRSVPPVCCTFPVKAFEKDFSTCYKGAEASTP